MIEVLETLVAMLCFGFAGALCFVMLLIGQVEGFLIYGIPTAALIALGVYLI